MNSFVCTLAIGTLAISAWADDKLGHQKRDWYDKDKVNTYDYRGNKTGYLKRDWYDKDKLNTYDHNGRKTGYQKLDWYDKDKLNLFRRCP